MARPSDWSPVDMDRDPTPGNPDEVRELADDLQTFADDVGEALGRILGMAEDRAVLDWAGLSAEAFRSEFDGVPPNLQKLQTSYDMAAQALQTYWPKLETAQGMADRALDRAIAAQADLSTAQAALSDAQDWVTRAGDEADHLEREGERENVEPPSEAEVRAATRDATAANEAASSAQSRVDSAEEALSAARQLALSAKEMREEAARTCASEIDAASDAGIQNRRWWEDAIHWVSENWDTIVETCKVVVAVLGIVVMIIGGPLAWVVLAAALVVLADTLYDYANGRASLWDVAFAALDCVPGMKGLTTLGGLAAGARALARGGLRGMATGLRGLATRGRTMLADGMQAARSRFRTLIRSNGSDPVDMATGTMFLPQTDITLPGVLPLAFTRRVESGYRAGRWFGPSWSSTCDQRLEIDDEGVVFVAEDGMLLAYPHPPASETQVLPETGPRWPLSHAVDGSYALSDPETGHVRRFSAPRPGGVALLREISDRNGNRIDFDYDIDGTPLAIRHSCGYHLKLVTEGDRITALRLANAGADGSDVTVREYRYHAGNLISVINAADGALRFTYDDRLRVTSWTDSNDRRYDYSYDGEDRCVAEGGAAGHISITLDHDGSDPAWPGARVTTVATPEGAVSRFVVNDLYQVVAEIDALGNVTRTDYDEHHHVVAWTDAEGNRTAVARDDQGRLVSVTRADGGTTRFSHDDPARRTRATLPDGATWLREYDEHGNCTATTNEAGETTRYTFDDVGGLASVTDPLGATTRIRCNAAGLPVEISDPLGNRVTRRHDAFGRLSEVTDALGARTRMWWTVDGQLARVVAPDGTERSWVYDGEGNCVRHVDEHGGTTSYEYTHFDLLAAQTGPDGRRHEFTYDASLRLTSVTNPQGLTWHYEYDAAGRLTAETDFDGRRVTYRRDALGRVVQRTNAAGQRVSYEFDELGLIRAKNVDGRVTTYQHDLSGRMLRASGPESEIRWERDAVGRILGESVDGRQLSFRYDAAGQRIERVTPGGARAVYAYDDAGRPVSLDTSGHLLSFTHDAAGQEISRRVNGTLALTQDWDLAGRLTEQTVSAADADAPVQRRAYAYRADGNLLGVEDLLRGPSRFALDGAGRVTEVEGRNWRESYAYDQAGNQSRAQWPEHHADLAAQGDRTYLGTRLTRAGSVRYRYDAAGRVSQRVKTRLSHKPDVWHYTWDAEDRLTAVTTPDGTTWRYGYDPMGRRTAKRRMASDGVTVAEETRFTWDGPTVIEQRTSGPGLPAPTTLTWDYTGTRPLAQTERRTDPTTQEEIDARFFAIVTDLVGTPTELLDNSGQIAWQARGSLWGLTAWRADASAYTPLRFPGQYHDPETGLHYNCLRYYDPETARYASPDPLGLHPAPNPVAYVANPHTWTDPLGLGPYQVGQILGNTSGLGGWIPTSVPDESWAVLRDIREFGVEAQGAGPQLRGPSIPQRFENNGRGGGYQLPQFDNAGQEIRYTEWGTVQSADNTNWGGERIVTGSDGSAYYSPTHYQTWIVMEAGR